MYSRQLCSTQKKLLAGYANHNDSNNQATFLYHASTINIRFYMSRVCKILSPFPPITCLSEPNRNNKSSTVKPRYSVFQGTDQNCALHQGSLYCRHIHVDNYENTSWNQDLYALLAELC